jgi:hypothetical protein
MRKSLGSGHGNDFSEELFGLHLLLMLGSIGKIWLKKGTQRLVEEPLYTDQRL